MPTDGWQTTLSALAARDNYGHADIHTIVGDTADAGVRSFAAHMHNRNLAHVIKEPHTKSAQALMGAAYTTVTRNGPRNIFIIIAEPQTKGLKLGQVLTAAESIKDGRLYRAGKQWKTIRVDRPVVIVFTAHKPRPKFLGPSEKWRMWSIEDGKLTQYDAEKGTPQGIA
jgi:hypothetical protein